MTKTQKTFVLATFALVIVAFSAYYSLNTTKKVTSDASFCAKDALLAQKLVAKGEVAALKLEKPRLLPALVFKNEVGELSPMSLFKGKVTLLNLWATWCVPCKVEMPALNRLQEKLGDENFQVVAINIDQRNLERATDFLAQEKITALKNYSDPTAKVFQELKSANLAFGMPTTLLIGNDGCVIASLSGAAEWASDDAFKAILSVKKQ